MLIFNYNEIMRMKYHFHLILFIFFSLFLSSCSLWYYKIPEEKILVTKGIAKKEIVDSQFSVLVWNIYKGQKDEWKNEYEKIKKDHDLLILQEDLCCKNHIESRYQKIFAKSFYYSGNEGSTGVSTLSSTSAIYSKVMRSQGREPIISTPKMALITKYPFLNNNKDLLVANIHSLNFVSNENWNQQLSQLLKELSNHVGPLILAGDFNTWNDERLEILLSSTQKLGLKSVIFKNGDARMKVFGNALDHVFYRDLSVKTAHVISSDGSDHMPLSVRFEMTPISYVLHQPFK
jgi:endonuclease/exonuclease/phosphatase (EEP) superfamily protein YafD